MRFLKNGLLAICLGLQILSAMAQNLASRVTEGPPKVNDVYKDQIRLSKNQSIPLPPGTWLVNHSSVRPTQQSVSSPDGGFFPHQFDLNIATLANLEDDNPFKLVVIRYLNANGRWANTPCSTGSKTGFFGQIQHAFGNPAQNENCSQMMAIPNIMAFMEASKLNDQAWNGALSKISQQSLSHWPQSMLLIQHESSRWNGRKSTVSVFVDSQSWGSSPETVRLAFESGTQNDLAKQLKVWQGQYAQGVFENLISSNPQHEAALAFQWPLAMARSDSVRIDPSGAILRPQLMDQDPSTNLRNDTATRDRASTSQDADETERSRLEQARDLRTQELMREIQTVKPTTEALAQRPAPASEENAVKLREQLALQQATQLRMERDQLAAQLREQEQQRAQVAQLNAELNQLRQQLAQASATAPPAAAKPRARRQALVMGLDNYQDVPKLKNARADAQAMAQQLVNAGFEVTARSDLSERGMKDAIRQFKSQIQGGDEVVVFFAGHGVQLGTANYLLPVDIRGQSEDQVKDEAIPLQRLLDDLQESKARFAMAIIDACRDNPFKTVNRAIGGRGLTGTAAATGQMVVFSAGVGQQALDRLGQNDPSPNGVFTRVLLTEMQKPGLSVDRVIRNVRNEVVRLSQSIGHEQVPAVYDQAIGDFYFKP